MSSHLPINPNLGILFDESKLHEIWLAGGCFWGVDAYLRRIPGVAKTDVGYANGNTENPSYQEVCYHNTGHAEAVHLYYNPETLSLIQLLREFYHIIDSTSLNKQGGDTGTQYRTGIYFTDSKDIEAIAEATEEERKKHKKPVVTEILPLSNYYVAEDYHQDYLEKNPNGYCHIHF